MCNIGQVVDLLHTGRGSAGGHPFQLHKVGVAQLKITSKASTK